MTSKSATASGSGLHKTSTATSTIKGFSYTQVAVALVVLLGAYYTADKSSALSRFSEAVTERLCDTVPAKATPTNEATPTTATPTPAAKLDRGSSYYKFAGGKSYNAKDAMDARHLKLQSVCNRYGDPMIPEYRSHTLVPPKDSFIINPKTRIALCGLDGLAKKSFKALFDRIRSAADNDSHEYKGWEDNYIATAKSYKKAIFVRHPMERLISVYRKTFAAAYNPNAGEAEEEQMSFPDFIYLVLEGPHELAEYIQKNRMSGESIGIDTGMVDGKGMSRKWAPFWHQCGLCHLDYRPHYILHFDHAQDDEEVLVELLGNKETAKEWLKVKHEHIAANEETIKHFYSQLTKEEIRGIYHKYKMDFDLFGYSPDYYIQFGSE